MRQRKRDTGEDCKIWRLLNILEAKVSQTVGLLFHIALYPVFEVGYVCVDGVQIRITLPLVIAKAHQSQESPQPFVLLFVGGLVLGEGREDKNSPSVRRTYVRGHIVRLLAGTEHIVCDADWHAVTSILLLTRDHVRKVDVPDPRPLIGTQAWICQRRPACHEPLSWGHLFSLAVWDAEGRHFLPDPCFVQ